jgi:hypothetical protein
MKEKKWEVDARHAKRASQAGGADYQDLSFDVLAP